MGRQIAAWLEAQPQRHPVRFELDSYHAILAMVAQGQGWTILTPLGLLHAAQFLDALDVAPLTGVAMERRLSLSARAGVMRDLPAEVAGAIRTHLAALVIAPAIARWGWLAPHLRLF
jgi:DNA-binding transcriptional LysR family regulator